MVSFNKFFSSVFLAIVYASIVRATPQTFAAAEHETRRSRHVGRGLSLESFHPPTTYKVSPYPSFPRIDVVANLALSRHLEPELSNRRRWTRLQSRTQRSRSYSHSSASRWMTSSTRVAIRRAQRNMPMSGNTT